MTSYTEYIRTHSEHPDNAIKRVLRQLGRMKQQTDTSIERQEKAIEEAKARGVRGETLQNMLDQLSDYKAVMSKAIRQAEAERDELQGVIAAETTRQREEARASLGALKARARLTWLDQGGTAEGFESAWPGMESQLLSHKVSDVLEQSEVDHPRTDVRL